LPTRTSHSSGELGTSGRLGASGVAILVRALLSD